MNGPDINSPFAQALIAEGVKRGYTPFDIAGSIGNAYQENKLNTTGVPGDNGTAFGGMQWRKGRFDGLKAEAQKQGKDWTDPAVQASHWFNEQDAAGNKGATDIDTANNQVIGSLAPRGYKPGQEQNADGYTNRLTASQQALAAMNGALAPVDPNRVDPDVPSARAQNVSGVGDPSQTGGVLNQSQVPQYEPTLGDKLDRLSAAFLRRDSPGAAAQIDNSLQARINGQRAELKARQASDNWKTGGAYQNADGKWMQQQTNSQGAIRNVPVAPEAIPAADPDKPASTAEVRAATAANTATQNLEQLDPLRNAVNTLREAYQKGSFEVGPDKTGQMIVHNLTGNSTENDRYLKSQESNIIAAASIVAQSQKGSMTNFKFAKDLQQVMPSFAANDKKAAYESLTRVSEGLNGAYNANLTAVNRFGTMFPKSIGQTFDGDKGEMVPIGDYYGAKAKAHAEREAALKAGAPAFLSSPGRGATGGPAPGFTKGGYKFNGGDPAKQENWTKVD